MTVIFYHSFRRFLSHPASKLCLVGTRHNDYYSAALKKVVIHRTSRLKIYWSHE